MAMAMAEPNQSAIATVAVVLDNETLRRLATQVAALIDARPLTHWLNMRTASEYTSLTEEALRTAVKRGKLRRHKGESGRIVFERSDLDTFMRELD